MQYTFYYETHWNFDNEVRFSRGFLIADSYKAASAHLEKVYDIVDIKLKMLGDVPVIEIPDNIEFNLEPWEEANGF